MKLTNRAKSALATAGYPIKETSAIAQLVAFAAQNSGIEFANYGEWRSFKSEQRSISEDWRRFKQALAVAAIDGVTDSDVIAEAPHAFSGRLTWESGDEYCVDCGWRGTHTGNVSCPKCQHISIRHTSQGWSYCTGQYFPTEYRKAAATLLEYATRNVRRKRPPESRQSVTSIAELKELNEKNGGCWFGRGEMRFFGTRIESGIIGKRYFISSEQPPHGSRSYSIRTFDEKGSVDTFGEFCGYSTKSDALTALHEHLSTEIVKA